MSGLHNVVGSSVHAHIQVVLLSPPLIFGNRVRRNAYYLHIRVLVGILRRQCITKTTGLLGAHGCSGTGIEEYSGAMIG